MSETITVKCPSCAHEFPLNDAVLGSVRDHLSQELQASIRQREEKLQAAMQEREQKLDARLATARDEEAKLKQARQDLQDELEKRLASELKARQGEIERKAAAKAGEAHALELRALQEDLAAKNDALRKAREAELALRKERQKLEADRENLELETQRKLDAEREQLKEQISKQEAERASHRQAELEKKLLDAQKANDDLRRKLEQGSQQTQGEVLELEIENSLRNAFPIDRFEEVPKGVRGADLIQRVHNRIGHPCGTIVYETKQTKSWSKDWIPKLKDDIAKVKGDVPVLITAALPEGIDTFGQLEGVWVCSATHALPLVSTLRWSLIELTRARAASEGMEDNKDLLYKYFTGPEFRNRLETIVTTFDGMRTTLEQEKKSLTKLWAAREKQIEKVVLHLTGMQGDIQGIAGTHSLKELDTLALEE